MIYHLNFIGHLSDIFDELFEKEISHNYNVFQTDKQIRLLAEDIQEVRNIVSSSSKGKLSESDGLDAVKIQEVAQETAQKASKIMKTYLGEIPILKVNSIDSIKNKVKVSVIPLKELELNIPADDDSIIQTLKNSSYAAIFTEESIIILANGMTIDGRSLFCAFVVIMTREVSYSLTHQLLYRQIRHIVFLGKDPSTIKSKWKDI